MKTEKHPLFFKLYENTKKIVVLQGGTSSGKTYTALDFLLLKGIEKKGIIITVVGQDIPNLKAGAFRDAKKILSESELYKQWYTSINETERIIKCHNGSLLEFKSYADEQDAKSGKRDYLFVNEADGIPFGVFWQLNIRTKDLSIVDYNPTIRFWAHDIAIQDNAVMYITDHRHNSFLTQQQHDEIEATEDPELFKVYARGLTGNLQGAVITNWEKVAVRPEHYKKRFIGVDYGYQNDPTAVVEVLLTSKGLYVEEIAYEVGLDTDKIFRILQPYRGVEIIAESAEPRLNDELRAMRLMVTDVNKIKIMAGIMMMHSYRLLVNKNSTNIINELGSYIYRKVRKNGVEKDEPKDADNHAIDAIRYVVTERLRITRKRGGRISTNLKSYGEYD